MNNQRVVITGMGAICGLGHNLSEVWNHLIEGQSGISKIEQFDTTDLPVHFAGEIKNFILSEDILPLKDHDRYDRFIHLALHATFEAWNKAGINFSQYKQERIGCILGTGLGGFPRIETTHDIYREKGDRRISTFFFPLVISNI